MGATASVGLVSSVSTIITIAVLNLFDYPGSPPVPRTTCLELKCPTSVNLAANRLRANDTFDIYWSEPDCKCCKRMEQRVYQKGRDVRKGDIIGPGSFQGHYWAADDIGHEVTCQFPVNVGAARCEQLPVSPNGKLTCSRRNLHGSTCEYMCNDGYRVRGPSFVTCDKKDAGEFWSAESSCASVTCPPGTEVLPSVLDGHLECDGNEQGHICHYICNQNYVIPRSQRSAQFLTRSCQASGEWSNGSLPTCKRRVRPLVKYCSSNRIVNATSMAGARVRINKPFFIDHLGHNIRPFCGRYVDDTYTLPVGSHEITCRATDTELDTIDWCTYKISVVPRACANLRPPDDGAMACVAGDGVSCKMDCRDGYDVIPQNTLFDGTFFCKQGGNWIPTYTVPDCSPSNNPRLIKLPAEVFYYFGGECDEEALDELVRRNVVAKFNVATIFQTLCIDYKDQCSVEIVSVRCGMRGPPTSRRKRTSQPHRPPPGNPVIVINYRLVLTLPANTSFLNSTDYQRLFNKAKDLLLGVFTSVKNEMINGNINLESLFPEIELTLAQDSFTQHSVDGYCSAGKVLKNSTGKCVACPRGFYNVYNEGKCMECPVGHYQDQHGQLACEPCPLGKTTDTTGVKNQSLCVEIDDCKSRPCANGGYCIDGPATFSCLCPMGYTGRTCRIHDCLINKCRGNATCVGRDYGYSCDCPEEYSGEFCETKKVHGGFGEFSEWTKCSHPCNGGEQERWRSCNNPEPKFGGRSCVGEETEVRECNTHACPECKPSKLLPPRNGSIECDETGQDMVCTAKCDESFGFGSPVPTNGTYTCGPSTNWRWPYQSIDNMRAIIPQCTSHVPSIKNFLWINKYPSTNCEDEMYIRTIEKQIAEKTKLLTDSLSCITDTSCDQPAVKATCPNLPERPKREAVDDRSIVVIVAIQVNVTDAKLKNVLLELDALAEEAKELAKNGGLNITIEGISYGPTEDVKLGSVDTCPIGSVVSHGGRVCVMCRPGTFYTTNANNGNQVACALCDQGFYQPEEGQTSCIPCPVGGNTDWRGSVTMSDCSLVCNPGSFHSTNATNKRQVFCAFCNKGFYQPGKGQASCLPCPNGGYTEETGSLTIEKCIYPPEKSSTTTAPTTPETIAPPAARISKKAVIMMSVFIPLVVIIVVAIGIYCICCRGRRKSEKLNEPENNNEKCSKPQNAHELAIIQTPDSTDKVLKGDLNSNIEDFS